ncbi:hypothetical protein, partial [Neokomagataea thailandica]|uniref:hypothetical protein n=1 Tax=Neokomagataea thailandica TaxID=661190 RepID=UPI001C3F91F7
HQNAANISLPIHQSSIVKELFLSHTTKPSKGPVQCGEAAYKHLIKHRQPKNKQKLQKTPNHYNGHSYPPNGPIACFLNRHRPADASMHPTL